jgi:hypothetical protein
MVVDVRGFAVKDAEKPIPMASFLLRDAVGIETGDEARAVNDSTRLVDLLYEFSKAAVPSEMCLPSSQIYQRPPNQRCP